jgi:GDPmannose 4,6-dehydratase
MYGLFACNGILFNHESPRRGDDYVTRKITKGLAQMKAGKQKELRLGNLHSKRDWGYSKEYVEVAWMILQQSKPDDFVIGTGETHTVDEWLTEALELTGVNRDVVIIDQKLYRPAEVYELCADYSKAKKVLGWEPQVRFKELVRMMVEADLKDV